MFKTCKKLWMLGNIDQHKNVFLFRHHVAAAEVLLPCWNSSTLTPEAKYLSFLVSARQRDTQRFVFLRLLIRQNLILMRPSVVSMCLWWKFAVFASCFCLYCLSAWRGAKIICLFSLWFHCAAAATRRHFSSKMSFSSTKRALNAGNQEHSLGKRVSPLLVFLFKPVTYLLR